MKSIGSDRYVALIDLFKARRLQRNLRQEDLADKLGWHRNTISRLELRQRRLDIVETLDLAHELKITVRRIEAVLRTRTRACA